MNEFYLVALDLAVSMLERRGFTYHPPILAPDEGDLADLDGYPSFTKDGKTYHLTSHTVWNLKDCEGNGFQFDEPGEGFKRKHDLQPLPPPPPRKKKDE